MPSAIMTEQQTTPPRSVEELDDDQFDDCHDGEEHHASDSKTSAPIQKRRRVTRACDTCRGKKIKCDGKQPCTHCTVYSYDCTYDQPSNRRRNPAPQYIEALENRLARAEALLKTVMPNADLNDPNLGNGMLPPLVQFPPQMPRRGAHASEEDRGSVLQSMIDRTGSLDLDPEGRLEFYGSSSGRVFYERISRQMGTFENTWNATSGWNDHDKSGILLREKKKAYDSPRSADSPGDVDGGPNLHDLPTKDVGRALCESALDDAMCLLRFMHGPSFWKMFDRIYDVHFTNWTTDEHRYLPVIYAAMSLGTLFAKTENSRLQIDGYELAMENGFVYFKAATSMMDLTDIRDLYSLQAALLLTYFIQSSAKLSTCYSYVGVCLFGALRMGMHRQCIGKFNRLESELRKRCFWQIRKMDIFVAGTLGLPVLLSEEDIDQEYPADVDDEFITPEGLLPQPDDRIAPATAGNVHMDLYRILGKILKTIYPVRTPTGGGAQGQPAVAVSYSKVREIEKNLQDWMEAMPMGLRPGSGGNHEMVRLQYLLRMSYSHVQIILYRPFLHYVTLQGQKNTGDQRFYACAAACVHVARNSIHIMSEMNRRHLLIGAYWFQMYTTFWAVLVLVFYSVENQDNKSPHEYFNAAIDGKDMLAMMAKSSAAADRCNAVLSQLFSKLPERFRRGRQTSTSSASGTRKRHAQSNPRVEADGSNGNSRNQPRPVSAVYGAPPRASTMPQNTNMSAQHKRKSLSGMNFSGPNSPNPFTNSPMAGFAPSPNDLTHSATSTEGPSSPSSTFNFPTMGSSAETYGMNSAVHELASMIFPSNDPFAYPNQPMTTFENQFGMEPMNGTFDLGNGIPQPKMEPGTVGDYMQNMQSSSQPLGPSVPADFMTGDWARGSPQTNTTQAPQPANGMATQHGQFLNDQGITYDTLFGGGELGMANMSGSVWFNDPII